LFRRHRDDCQVINDEVHICFRVLVVQFILYLTNAFNIGC
jgi:hypothetical protein